MTDNAVLSKPGSAEASEPAETTAEDASRPRRYRNWASWAVFAAVLVLLLDLLLQIVRNERLDWPIVGEYLFDPTVLDGLRMTLVLTVLATACAYVLGTVVAVMQLSANPGLRLIGGLYVWLFRSVPQLVLLLIFFNLAAFAPVIELGLPGLGLSLGEISSRRLINGFMAAIIALSLSEGAYAAEVIRGGIVSVDRGQVEAASALGIPSRRILFRIVLPQAMRAIVPALGNAVIGMLKTTSLVSTIAVHDLLYNVQVIYNANFDIIPLLIVATIWYLVWTTVLSIVQYFVESYFGRGHRTGTGGRGAKAFFKKLIDDPSSVLSGRR